MYYIICTIIIMVFCITALTNSNTTEREFFFPVPKPPSPQTPKAATECTIKRSVEPRFEIITSLGGDKQNNLCVKAIPIALLAPRGIDKQVKLNQYYSANSLTNTEQVRSGYFTDKTVSVRKDIATTSDNRSCTVSHMGHHHKPTASPIFLLTLIIPVTPFFLTNTKNDIVRRVSTTADQSLRQLRYVISQPGINNEWIYRRVLKLRSQHEKIRI
ncbi:hypothetical protein AAFN85_05260 [Mucilaginibacter sp. CAU 1740]|uniref:hypothetical protein n=1 Tax=Mucilaginibacter sp. CAU 1740 TaxID=3140365 RepID=UPI00325C1F6B